MVYVYENTYIFYSIVLAIFSIFKKMYFKNMNIYFKAFTNLFSTPYIWNQENTFRFEENLICCL